MSASGQLRQAASLLAGGGMGSAGVLCRLLWKWETLSCLRPFPEHDAVAFA